ncbi:MAG: amino acid ABC transporter permease [Rhodospirillales bacterium]|nr:amino acid ABC transporter permease [Rhodospirillales bacterium]
MDQAALYTLLLGAWTTAWISAVAIAGGVPLGLALALLREARIPVVEHFVVFYVSLGRATPLVTLVLFIFVGAPVLGIPLDRYAAAIATLLLNTAAFNAEVWRAAIRSFPREQVEAARATGMTRALIFRRIMLPQIWITSLPGLVNEMTLLIKASPAIAVIGIVDLTRVTNRISAITYEPLPPILAAAALYMVVIGMLVRLQRLLDARAHRLAM